MRGCGNKSPYPRGSEIVHPGGVGIRWTGNVGQVMRSKKQTKRATEWKKQKKQSQQKRLHKPRGWGALFSTRGTGRVEGKQEVIFELVIAVLLKHFALK